MKDTRSFSFILEAYTTDKILIFSVSGRFFTFLVDNIFRGKGNGESVKLMIDIGNEEIVSMFVLMYILQISLMQVNQGKYREMMLALENKKVLGKQKKS
jgi:DNA gyrase/topoisomerase IV subunit A